jgi:GT2 family glycosyltransferase
MFASCDSDFLLVLNPDIVVPHDFFEAMLAPFSDDAVGLTEARQTPVEHPKRVNLETGEVEWASGACFIMPAALFRELGGFDDHNFFMYFEDVDLSMRIRQKQKKLIYCADAPVYHSKGFDKRTGQMQHANTELYFSAEAALAFAYKWHQKGWLSYLRSVYKSGTDHQRRALAAFEARLSKGKLTRIEGDTSVFQRKYLDNRYQM